MTSLKKTVFSWWRILRSPVPPRLERGDSGSVKSHRSDASSRDVVPRPKRRGGLCSYTKLLRSNRNYRLFLISHLCQHAGDWFVHVAGLIAIEQLVPDSGTAISILVATKMIPMIIFTYFGGALADNLDRRKLMIALDAWNATIAIFYILALQSQSPNFFYIVSFIRHTVVAIYEPITRSIVPLLVGSDDDLKIAMTMNGIAWAITLAVGGTVAGWTAARLGVGACYIVDSSTYVISTVVMWMVTGKYCVREIAATSVTSFLSSLEEKPMKYKFQRCLSFILSPVVSFARMFMQLMGFLIVCKFGMLVFMKATGQLTWGSADVINIHFAHMDKDEVTKSKHIGLMYSSVGIGCLLGPIFANNFTDMEHPRSLQFACVSALGVISFGWVGMSMSARIEWLCFFNTVRAFGSAIIWINSTLLLQKLTPSGMLGRILSFDFAIAMLFDTIASFVTGRYVDADTPIHDVAFGAAVATATIWVFWSLYHSARLGAARKSFNAENIVSPSVSCHSNDSIRKRERDVENVINTAV